MMLIDAYEVCFCTIYSSVEAGDKRCIFISPFVGISLPRLKEMN